MNLKRFAICRAVVFGGIMWVRGGLGCFWGSLQCESI